MVVVATLGPNGYGSNINHEGTAAFSPRFHAPGKHFEYQLFTLTQMCHPEISKLKVLRRGIKNCTKLRPRSLPLVWASCFWVCDIWGLTRDQKGASFGGVPYKSHTQNKPKQAKQLLILTSSAVSHVQKAVTGGAGIWPSFSSRPIGNLAIGQVALDLNPWLS